VAEEDKPRGTEAAAANVLTIDFPFFNQSATDCRRLLAGWLVGPLGWEEAAEGGFWICLSQSRVLLFRPSLSSANGMKTYENKSKQKEKRVVRRIKRLILFLKLMGKHMRRFIK